MPRAKKMLRSRGRSSHVSLILGLLAIIWITPPTAKAEPPLLSQFCGEGSSADQCWNPVGIATDPNNGNIYVNDPENHRIDDFTVWGQFIKAFGGGVVNGGATGSGTLVAGSPAVTSFSTTSKAFVPGMLVEGTGIQPGTTIASIDYRAITLSKPATAAATGTTTAITSPAAPNNVPTNELQQIGVTATGGTFKLGFETQRPDAISQSTASNIPYNATAEEVQGALEGLSNIGPTNIAVTSSNPGGKAGVPGGPYTVEFTGPRFSDTNVLGLSIEAGSPDLSGGSATVEPVRQGASSVEVCTGLDCRQGVEGDQAGQFASPHGVTTDSEGNLYVYESAACTGGIRCVDSFQYTQHGNNRVQKFNPDGNFELMFGGNVDQGGGTPSNPGNVCTATYIASGDICGGGAFGAGNGEFGEAANSGVAPFGGFIAAGPSDTIYVGGNERIQEFEPNGALKGLLPDPQGVLTGKEVQSLAVDPSTGDLYVAFLGKKNVYRLSPSGVALATLSINMPQALSVDTAGRLYVVDGSAAGDSPVVRQFTGSASQMTEVPGFTFSDQLVESRGIATSSACGMSEPELYVGNIGAVSSVESYVRAYGPPPDATVCSPPVVEPSISSQFVTSVGTNEATLKAEINPHFWPDAHYYVQYGLNNCAEGGCVHEKPTPPGSDLTTATTAQDISTTDVLLTELQPDTTYHYRFVTQSGGGGPIFGEDHTFRTYASPSGKNEVCSNNDLRVGASSVLPDCRAYEMVSPLDKNNGDVLSANNITGYSTALDQSATDGSAFTYTSYRGFGNPQSAPFASQYLARRDAKLGWMTESLAPARGARSVLPNGEAIQTEYKAFSADLSSAWLRHDTDPPLDPEAPAGYANLYRRDNADGSYQTLSKNAPGEGEIVGFSMDGSHALFQNQQLYESFGSGKVRLVSVLPSGKPSEGNATAGGQNVGAGLEDRFGNVTHAMSSDGSRIYWTEENGLNTGAIYLRANGKNPTLKVSKSASAHFETASADGLKAIYREKESLYEYDAAAKESNLIAGEVSRGLLGASEDVSRLYFVSGEVLTGVNTQGKSPVAHQANLYFFNASNGGADRFHFLGTLEGVDLNTEGSPVDELPYYHTGHVSSNGEFAVFPSTAPLTGYDNTDVQSGEPDAEVFLFSASANAGEGGVVCISCSPSLGRPSGRELRSASNGSHALWAAATLPSAQTQLYIQRVISEDGKRVFFNAYDALSLRDGNGKEDVYEWESGGFGDCTAESASFVTSSGGCLYLISSGQSQADSELLDSSANGDDVFFSTVASLLPQDAGLIDVYDARVGGGFPPPPGQATACEGEACQGSPEPPNDPTPASSSFDGPGNVKDAKTARCAKGKARHKGRCVGKKRKRGKRANDKRGTAR